MYLCFMASEETITISRAEYQAMKQQIGYLTHQLSEMKRLIFGSKRERFISAEDSAQGILFDIPEAEPIRQQEEEITYKRKKAGDKKQPLRTELPAHLPRREEVIDPDPVPEGAKRIGQAVTEILEYEPATLYVRRIVRNKYVIETTGEATNIIIADLPTLPIAKGNAGAGLLSHLLISKYTDHLPFYRQVQMFKRQGVTLAESTVSGWFTSASKLLEPLYDTLKTKVISATYLMADETPIPVLTKDKPGATHKGYHWVYYAPEERLVLFDYRKHRNREGPEDILKSFTGYLQTDGYNAYNELPNHRNITLLACMAHARRYFDKAKENDPQRAKYMLQQYQRLYAIEEMARKQELDAEQVKGLRQENAIPVLKEMEQWLNEEIYKVLPKSAIGKAIAYNLKLWPRLIRYTEQGRFHIDNNLIENSIRPVALGRKNYLFAGSHEAAQQAAMIYSLLATCKINDREPFTWMKNILTIIPDYPANQLHILLPGK